MVFQTDRLGSNCKAQPLLPSPSPAPWTDTGNLDVQPVLPYLPASHDSDFSLSFEKLLASRFLQFPYSCYSCSFPCLILGGAATGPGGLIG